MVSHHSSDDRDYYRQEAMGAFAHEIRTPLTSLRMVVELARRQAGGRDTLLLDAELAGMLHQSIAALQQLADDLQEQSRLERGRIVLGDGPCELAAAIEAAREMLRPGIDLACPEVEPLNGPWDAPRLVKALAGFADGANRIGDGSGVVRLDATVAPDRVHLVFSSGRPGGASRPVAADAGFGFFRARQYVLAAGGAVDCDRRERYLSIAVTLRGNAGVLEDTAQ